MTYFRLSEAMSQKNKYLIEINFNTLPLQSTDGSFAVLFARLLNMSYVDYLRYCRDICGATVVGKNCKYPVAYFSDNIATKNLLKILNERASAAVKGK